MLSKEEWKRKKKIRRYIRLGVICAIAIAVLIIAFLGLKALFSTVFSPKDTPSKRAEALLKQINIDEQLLTPNQYIRPQLELKKVDGIVIHFVGKPGKTAQEVRDYFESLKAGTENISDSCHYILGLNGEIIQCIPLNEVAYASGKRNSDTIAIEYCHDDSAGALNDETYNSMVTLTAYLMEKYGLTTDKIIRHYDATGVVCPKYLVDDPGAWQAFLNDVQKASDESLKKQ